jgi:predicted nucleic acid-binding protein
MIHSVKFTCVLDANVIYPIEIRDLLLWFAHFNLFTPKWSQGIFEEWISVMKRKGVESSEIERRVKNVNQAFPDALVENYESLIEGLQLPDPKDRHVLAAAIKTNANIIVTNNLSDFPEDYLASYGLSAKGADDFITDTIDLNQHRALEAFRRLVSIKRKPPLNEYEVLSRYRKLGLANAADFLHTLI